MAFGQQAFENSHQPPLVVNRHLLNDTWDNNNVEDFVRFWSGNLWLTIKNMQERVDSVFTNILIPLNPDNEAIITGLKTKQRRWSNEEVNRIAPIIRRFLVRNVDNNFNQLTHHSNFQNELGALGPVRTIWCHYLIEPIAFPPIDRFNYTACRFICDGFQNLPIKVPQNFRYLPIDNIATEYQRFREWFSNILNIWKGGNQTVIDVVNFDKALMSFGSFIQKNNSRENT